MSAADAENAEFRKAMQDHNLLKNTLKSLKDRKDAAYSLFKYWERNRNYKDRYICTATLQQFETIIKDKTEVLQLRQYVCALLLRMKKIGSRIYGAQLAKIIKNMPPELKEK